MWAAEFIHWQLSTYHGTAFIKAYNLLHDGGLDQLIFLRCQRRILIKLTRNGMITAHTLSLYYHLGHYF